MTKDEIMTAVADGFQGIGDVLVTFIPEDKKAHMAYDYEACQYHLLIPENILKDTIDRVVASAHSRETQINAC